MSNDSTIRLRRDEQGYDPQLKRFGGEDIRTLLASAKRPAGRIYRGIQVYGFNGTSLPRFGDNAHSGSSG